MTRIAFVEFEEADSANRALDISGALLGEQLVLARCCSELGPYLIMICLYFCNRWR